MQREVWEMREKRWAGVREISPRHHFSLTSLRPIFLSSSILDDNIVLIWIPKTLSDMGLSKLLGEIKNIDNYRPNSKAWAWFHCCIASTIYSLTCSFLPSYEATLLIWISDLRLRACGGGGWLGGGLHCLAHYGGGCCFGWEVMFVIAHKLFVHISQWHRL